jgi:hypothetical protein
MKYRDSIEIYSVASDGYANKKSIVLEATVNSIFLQSVGYGHQNNQDNTLSDAICYVDPDDAFVVANANRLEGMYIKASLFGSDESASWYKVETVSVNRDHLLCNKIDNIEMSLNKTRPLGANS